MNGAVRTVSYAIVSVALALEEGMIMFLFLQRIFALLVISDVIIVYQCKTSIKGCNKLLLCIYCSSWYTK